MKSFEYIVQEEYKGKKIEVNVSEYFSFDGIEEAHISCPLYNPISRGLGHKEIRLTVDDVHNAIFKEFEISEKYICSEAMEEHDNFSDSRYFKIIVEYENQRIIVELCLNRRSDKAWIYCPFSAQVKSFTMKDNIYRDAIVDEIENAKRLIDNGYVFPIPITFDKIKKKVKNLF